MSEPKWAPAPWKADLGEAFRIRDADGGTLAMIQCLHNKGRFGGRRPPTQTAASAHLIAQSPRMAEELQGIAEDLASFIQCGTVPDVDWLTDNAESIDQVLAAARGES